MGKIEVHKHANSICLCVRQRHLYHGSVVGVYRGMFSCVPGEKQGGACAQWTDEMNGQFSSLVVRESEASLNVFQRGNKLRSSPAGIHVLAEHQLISYVSERFDKRRAEWLMSCGCRNGCTQ